MALTRTLYAAAAALLLGDALHAQDAPITEAHLAIVDIDKDGSASKAEYRIYMSNAFILLDTDYDGGLSKADLSGLLSDEQFSATDADGDEVVTWAEFDVQTLRDFDGADLDGSGALD